MENIPDSIKLAALKALTFGEMIASQLHHKAHLKAWLPALKKGPAQPLTPSRSNASRLEPPPPGNAPPEALPACRIGVSTMQEITNPNPFAPIFEAAQHLQANFVLPTDLQARLTQSAESENAITDQIKQIDSEMTAAKAAYDFSKVQGLKARKLELEVKRTELLPDRAALHKQVIATQEQALSQELAELEQLRLELNRTKADLDTMYWQAFQALRDKQTRIIAEKSALRPDAGYERMRLDPVQQAHQQIAAARRALADFINTVA